MTGPGPLEILAGVVGSGDLANDALNALGVVAQRWPLAPLMAASRLPSRAALARALGVSGGAIAKAAERGCADKQADQWAVRISKHPGEVWGSAWFEAVDLAEVAS